MDIEVGEYVRTRGIIGKLVRIEYDKNDTSLKWYVLDRGINMGPDQICYVNKPYIEKHSHNIIDLIEVDDIVNGCRVMCLGKETQNCDYDIGTEYSDDFGEYFGYNKDEIETILTHEQMEANQYVVK